MSLLGDRTLAIHASLTKARIPHAFGGAIALAYCTDEPRGTRDIDVNIFLDPARARAVLRALPDGVKWDAADLAMIDRDGQVRLDWDTTPVDLFFSVHEFHKEVAGGTRTVPFESGSIPVLGCTALVVFKALFNRWRDWGDIQEVVRSRAVDVREAMLALERLVGPGDEAVARLNEVIASAGGTN